MFVVTKLGGCNGSGKTSVMRAMIDFYGFEMRTPRMYERPYTKPVPTILGSYKNVCGGMDTVPDKERVRELVNTYRLPGRLVFMEGLIVGKTYGYLGELSEADCEAGNPWLYAFMDTPFEVCVERVLQRRAAKGNDKPFDPERTMRPTFRGIQSLQKRVKAADHPIIMLDHRQKPVTLAKKLFTRALDMYDGK